MCDWERKGQSGKGIWRQRVGVSAMLTEPHSNTLLFWNYPSFSPWGPISLPFWVLTESLREQHIPALAIQPCALPGKDQTVCRVVMWPRAGPSLFFYPLREIIPLQNMALSSTRLQLVGVSVELPEGSVEGGLVPEWQTRRRTSSKVCLGHFQQEGWK